MERATDALVSWRSGRCSKAVARRAILAGIAIWTSERETRTEALTRGFLLPDVEAEIRGLRDEAAIQVGSYRKALAILESEPRRRPVRKSE